VDENIPDPLDAEQTWPTEEEIEQANSMLFSAKLFLIPLFILIELVQEQQNQQQKKRVPKGTSSYQAAWILEDDQEGQEVHSDEEDMMDKDPEFEEEEEELEEYEEIELDNRSVKFDVLDDEENEEQ
jgi:pre-rRNA-processing protein TSR1